MKRLGLVVLLSLIAAACQDQGEVAGPSETAGPVAPQSSVVVLDYTDIGAPLGGTRGRAFAVNDLGEIVGGSERPSGGTLFPFRWVNGTVQDLGDGSALDLNGSGVVVGRRGPPGSVEAVFWNDVTDGGTLAPVSVGPLEVLAGQEANALNDRGEIVGRADVTGEFGTSVLALYWASAEATTPTVLGDLGGVRRSTALDINNRGQIVGLSNDGVGSVPVAWSATDAQPQPLQPLPGGFTLGGVALGINDLGQIVGSLIAASGRRVAVVWPSQDAVPIDLGAPAGSVESGARAINELGQIVGSSGDAAFSQRAVLWMPEPGAYRAYDLGGPPGASEATASDLNNAGDLVGSAGEVSVVRAARWSIPLLTQTEVTPAPIKLDGKGRVTVAILTSPYFNAANIDPATLTLGDDDGLETPIVRKKKLAPVATLSDVDRDGDRDLVVEFEESQLMRNGDLTPASTALVLLGRLRHGKHIRGVDAVAVQ